MQSTIGTLEQKVIQWARERGIYDPVNGSTPQDQLDKAGEEFNELQRAIGAYAWVHKIDPNSKSLRTICNEIKDAYGDILVCLINAMHLDNLDMQTCLDHAYDQIKDRKGKMVKGKFVKQ